MTNKKQERDEMLTALAYNAARHLRSVGAVRRADNVDPPTVSVQELCEVLEIPESMWSAVRNRAWEEGLPLVFGYFSGYYLGTKGEQARLFVHGYYVMRGMAEAITEGFVSLSRSGTLDDAERYARLQLNCPLNSLPEMMKVLESPLPMEISQLLESGLD